MEIKGHAFTNSNSNYYIQRKDAPVILSKAFPDKAKIYVPYQYYNSYYAAWKQYASSLIPVIESDGKLQRVSFKNESLSDIDDEKTITSEGVAVTAPQTVLVNENFTVTYSFSDEVEVMSLTLSDPFSIVSGPQKGVHSVISNGSRTTVVEYRYILSSKSAGVYALPKLGVMLNGEEVFSPVKHIEVMHK